MISNKRTYFGLAVLLCFVAVSARAEERVSQLTNENITAFIHEAAEVSAGKSGDISFLNRHIADDARFQSTMTYRMKGQEPQQTPMELDKKSFIDNVKKGRESITDYKNSVTVGEITLAADGQKAIVQTVSHESGIMNRAAENGTPIQKPMSGDSNCNQTLILTEGTIQMQSAICVTTIQILD